MPLVRPVTVIGLVEPIPVKPPGIEVTVYAIIDEPPLLTGAVNATTAWVFPAVAVPIIGAPGTVDGITEFEAILGELLPFELVAITVKV